MNSSMPLLGQVYDLRILFYNYSVEFLTWLASDINEHVGFPVLSVVVVSLWFAGFCAWFIRRAMLVETDSQAGLVFRKVWNSLFVMLIFLLAGIAATVWEIYLHKNGSAHVLDWVWRYLAYPLILTLLLLSLISLLLGWLSVRHWLPELNYWVNEKLTKKGYQQSGFSDIRKVSEQIPSTLIYDPTQYWKTKSGQFFIGLTPEQEPICISRSEWCAQHQQVFGTTGFGKGVVVTNQLAQCLAMGQTVVVVDPKNDEWAPSVLLSIAAKFNRPVSVIDLNVDAPQFNPLYGADIKQLFDLFIGAFGLAESGADSDYYRTKERRVVRQWVQSFPYGQSLTQIAENLTEADFDNADKLCNELVELAMLGCINTRQKGGWYDIVEQGGLVYVIGSIRSEPVIRLQKMFILRLLQRLEARDRLSRLTHVTIFLDELKYLLCKPTLQALGTIRDKAANVILAHQSINDLLDVPADLEPQSVKSAVLENTALKFVYRSQDPDTVEWIARRSGTIPAHKEMLDQSRNEGFSEMTGAERRLIETERYLIDANTILALPKRCGVWLSSDPAQIVLTCPVITEKRNIYPNLVDPDQEPVQELAEEPALAMFS